MKSLTKVTTKYLGVLATLSIFSGQVMADTCVISRNDSNNPPIKWDRNDYVSNAKYSIYNPEACNLPPGNTITSVRYAFNANAKRSVLTRGLLHGDYHLRLTANGVSDDHYAGVYGYGLNSIGTSHTTNAFNGMDVSDFNVNIMAYVTGATSLRCRANDTQTCRNYMYYTYTIRVDYEPAGSQPPAPPASVGASLYNDDITINWADVPSATYYEREVSLLGAAYQNRKTYQAPQTQVTFFDQQARTYRYRVRACNDAGCSDWQYSNQITISLVPPKPASVSAAVVTGDDVRISWSRVSLANYYNREVSINGGAWQNTKKYYAPQTSVTFFDQQSRSYQYRVRACNSAANCSDWQYSNSVTVN